MAKQKSSKEIDWDVTKPEKFVALGRAWDISKAKEFIKNKPRKIEQFPVSYVKDYVENCGIDPENLCNVNLEIPIIVIKTKSGGMLPIDGWHRIYTAIQQNIEFLPMVVLNQRESKEIEC